MKRRKQLSFLPPQRLDHGGKQSKGKRKTARPIDTKRPLHLIFRAQQARGSWSLLHPKNAQHVDYLTRACARRHGIKLYRFVNVGNHMHLIVQGRARRHVQSFLRDITGTLAIAITGARKGAALKNRFWDHLAASRVVSWGRDFKGALDYLAKNAFEAAGLLTAAEKKLVRVITVDVLSET